MKFALTLVCKAIKDKLYIEQVLSDFFVTYSVQPHTKEDILQAASLRKEYHFSYWDSLIVASAFRSHCKILYT